MGHRYMIPADDVAEVTIYLRVDATEADHENVLEFGRENRLDVVTLSDTRHAITVRGLIADLREAFGVHNLEHMHDPTTGRQIRVRSGPICLPEKIAQAVIAVLGLDTRKTAHSRRVKPRFGVDLKPHWATEVARAYQSPEGLTGKGVKIGIIELGGGYWLADMQAYFAKLGLPVPTITDVSVLGAQNVPDDASGASEEVALDMQVAGAVAPGAEMIIYFAPNTDRGFVEAIWEASAGPNKCDILSISWGSAEVEWTPMTIDAMNTALAKFVHGPRGDLVNKRAIFAASGDNGSSDGESGNNVDFPAASEWSTGCGGTRLLLENGAIATETVWNDGAQGGAGGGGVSRIFERPAYQSGVKIPHRILARFHGRAVPDLAGCADPETGYRLILNGKEEIVGGTSAVAPLMAGLLACVVEGLGGALPTEPLNHALYKLGPAVFHDVATGNNRDGSKGYSASKGYDVCSGWGSIDATKLLEGLKPLSAPAPVVPKPSALKEINETAS